MLHDNLYFYNSLLEPAIRALVRNHEQEELCKLNLRQIDCQRTHLRSPLIYFYCFSSNKYDHLYYNMVDLDFLKLIVMQPDEQTGVTLQLQTASCYRRGTRGYCTVPAYRYYQSQELRVLSTVRSVPLRPTIKGRCPDVTRKAPSGLTDENRPKCSLARLHQFSVFSSKHKKKVQSKIISEFFLFPLQASFTFTIGPATAQ